MNLTRKKKIIGVDKVEVSAESGVVMSQIFDIRPVLLSRVIDKFAIGERGNQAIMRF